ncbi:hypothetical protein CDD83_5671 [Cordyceps sp. RAO-2017]|nr:hypothetical protein CDD83_5671 [Cordyceps sp. RAO-2017]
MALDQQARSKLAEELAYHLSWEFWMTDHAPVSQDVLDSLVSPDADPNDEETKKTLKDWWQRYWEEKRTDTVAVGFSHDGKDIVVAANLKKRTKRGIRNAGKKCKYNKSEFSLHDGRHDESIKRACAAFEATRGATVSVLVPEPAPESKEENAGLHAEMQIVRFASFRKMKIDVIGISKPACDSCAKVLASGNIGHVHNPDEHLNFLNEENTHKRVKRVTNWKDPTGGDFGNVRVRVEIPLIPYHLLDNGDVVPCQPGE